MKVFELIENLKNFANLSPQNGHAEVVMKLHDGKCYNISRADDAKGTGQHFLILVPDFDGGSFGVIGMVQ